MYFLLGRDDVPYFIAGCDLLLHPARSENTGTVILEALVGGLPEIVSAECGYAYHVKTADTGYILGTPFLQEEFNSILNDCVSKKSNKHWRDQAIKYSEKADLYSLTIRAAELIAT